MDYYYTDVCLCCMDVTLRLNLFKNQSPTFTLVSCLAYSSTLKRAAICASET
jgi:hypothetical protein